ELGQEALERRGGLVVHHSWQNVAYSAIRLRPQHAKITQVTRQCGLSNLPAKCGKPMPELLLAGDLFVANELSDRCLSVALFGHWARASQSMGCVLTARLVGGRHW